MLTSQLREYRQKHGNTGLYTTSYTYDTPNPDEANLFGDFYLDFDNEDDFEKVRDDVLYTFFYLKQAFTYAIPERMLHVFYSGKKGVHIIVPSTVMGIEPDKNLNEYFKFIADDLGSKVPNGTLDTRIYDRRRLLRMPNSRHKDTGLYKVPLSPQELKEMPLDKIKEKASTIQPYVAEPAYEIPRAVQQYRSMIGKWRERYEKQFNTKRNGEAKPLGFTPACTQELIDAGPQKGIRNNTAAVLVSHWHGEGLSEQEVWDKLVNWNRGSLTERELKVTLKSVTEGSYRYGCSTLETLATCIEKECPLWKGLKYQGELILEKQSIDKVKEILNTSKGEVCKEFEKVCPTDKSFARMVKEMHDVFDNLLEEIKKAV